MSNKGRLTNMRKYLIIILVLLAANFALFHKLYLQGLLPFPGDLLVSYYFPWNGGGFPGFDPWTTRKDVIAMDVIRQIYPWKTLAFDLIKQGQMPLWNPYNFSGTPLLANLQSSVFFPTGALFLLTPYLPAWITQVILLPLLLSFFSYIFLRSLKLSKIAALFGAIALSNLSYLTVWAEQIVVIQSALFLPLILWLINKQKFLWAAPLLAFSIFGGHIQTSVYVYLIVFAYALFKNTPARELLLTLVFSVTMSSMQLIPSLELYWLSARETLQSQLLFQSSTFPWQNLITPFAPDFFGNPATNNFRGIDYGNFQGFFGVVALVLSLFAAINFRRNKTTLFFLLLGIAGLVFALWPFALVFEIFKIPILSSGYPSRMIFVFQFSFAILAAFSMDLLLKGERSKIFPLLVIVGLVYIVSFTATFVLPEAKWQITRNNLILPISLFLATSVIILSAKFLPRKILVCLIILAVFDYSYFFNKYQPFTPAKFVFPKHPVFSEIVKNNKLSRYMGFDRAYIDSNFATYYRIYSPEGYDPLYPRRYSELLSQRKNVQRSDAIVPQENSESRDKLLDILGVKLVIDKTDDPQNDFGPNFDRFPKDKYTFIKQLVKWKFYERKNALPRAFLLGDFIVKTGPSEILETLNSTNFNPKKTVILEKQPGIKKTTKTNGSVKIFYYSPNRVEIETKSHGNKLLFLSDNFYPGWKAQIDGQKTEIYRANYTFRAVSLPPGRHIVIFEYSPNSFKLGLLISILSFGSFTILCLKKSGRLSS